MLKIKIQHLTGECGITDTEGDEGIPVPFKKIADIKCKTGEVYSCL
jgi:hypothetical protein